MEKRWSRVRTGVFKDLVEKDDDFLPAVPEGMAVFKDLNYKRRFQISIDFSISNSKPSVKSIM